MPLPAPNLDDRSFQDILDEARRLIPRYCPEWTDHNLSDPGITLLELFAWMTDMLLYRLNRVPDKNYVKFLELIGRAPASRPGQPRRTSPSASPRAQAEDMVIPQGTEIATVRTETQEVDQLRHRPRSGHARAAAGRTSWPVAAAHRFNDYRPALDDPRQGLGIFSDVPQENDAFLLGFANDLSAHTVAITFSLPHRGHRRRPDRSAAGLGDVGRRRGTAGCARASGSRTAPAASTGTASSSSICRSAPASPPSTGAGRSGCAAACSRPRPGQPATRTPRG